MVVLKIKYQGGGAEKKKLKENICSCDQCLKGNFRLCDTEPGRIFRKSSLPYYDDNESESDYDLEDDPESDSDAEEEIQVTSTLLDDITEGCYIAIFSSVNANELFYICKVKSIEQASHDVIDGYNHSIPAGYMYAVCQYLEKVSEHPRQKFVQYKLLQNSEVFVIQNQVFCPAVNVSSDLRIEMEEYLWLSDCI